jgi:hypothetical protein
MWAKITFINFEKTLGAEDIDISTEDKIHALAASNNDYEVFMTLSGEAKNEIRWWQNNIFDKNGKDIRPSKIQFYLETDASKAGWVPIFMV